MCRKLRFSSDVIIRNAIARKSVEVLLSGEHLENCETNEDYAKVISELLQNNFNNLLPDIELNVAMSKFSIAPKNKEKRRQYVNLVSDSHGRDNLYLVLPDVKNSSADIKETAAAYIHFAKCMLQIEDANVHLAFDRNLGNVIKYPKLIKDFQENLLKSARSSTGLILGMRTHTFKSGFKSPVPGILCAIRVLRKNLPYYRKLSKDSTHLQLLRDACNTELGVGTPGFDEYAKDFVIQVLEHMTSDTHNRFPASFYAVARSENNVKTTEGILASLKYISILPKVDKVIHVCTRCFEYDKNGQPTKVEGVSDGDVMRHDLQFQAGVRLLLPMLDKRNDVSLKEQVANPVKYLTVETQKHFKKNASHIDAITKAYAYSSAFSKKGKKKTKLVHVSNEVNKASREIVSSMPMQDSTGKTYENYMDLRYSLRKFIENLLKRRSSPKKRASQSVDPTDRNKKSRTSSSKSSKPSVKKTTSVSFADSAEEDMVLDTEV